MLRWLLAFCALLISVVSVQGNQFSVCNSVDISRNVKNSFVGNFIYKEGKLQKNWQFGHPFLASDEISVFTLSSKIEVRNVVVQSKDSNLFTAFRVTNSGQTDGIFLYDLEVQYQRCETTGSFEVSASVTFGNCGPKDFSWKVTCNVAQNNFPPVEGLMIGTSPHYADVVYNGIPQAPYDSIETAPTLEGDAGQMLTLYVWCERCEGVTYFSNPALLTDDGIMTGNVLLEDWDGDLLHLQEQTRSRTPGAPVPVSLDWFGVPERSYIPNPRRLRVESFCHGSGTSVLGARLHFPYRRDIALLWHRKCETPPPVLMKGKDDPNRITGPMIVHSLIDHLTEVAKQQQIEGQRTASANHLAVNSFGFAPLREKDAKQRDESTEDTEKRVEKEKEEKAKDSGKKKSDIFSQWKEKKKRKKLSPGTLLLIALEAVAIICVLAVAITQLDSYANPSRPPPSNEFHKAITALSQSTLNALRRVSQVFSAGADYATEQISSKPSAKGYTQAPIGAASNGNFGGDFGDNVAENVFDDEAIAGGGVFMGGMEVAGGSRNGYDEI